MELSEALSGAALVVVLSGITALVVGPSIWGLVDVSRTPDSAWNAIGRKKRNWIVAFAVGIWAWFIGLPAAILYLRNVRPDLKEAMDANEVAPGPGTARSKRALVVVGVLVGALWVFGMWAYLTHGQDEFFNPELAAQANAICADAKAELGELPPLPDSPTFEERARTVERTIPIYEGMVDRLRALAGRGENATFDEWLNDWHEFIQVGPNYADAIRTGDPAVFEPAGNAGDEPASAINDVARANQMRACVF
ncbi:MAG: DUF2516 family protein [Actinobacteria bacterium]|nr:DUF2516 family protein [Actinomycetota bacterium]